MTGDLVFPVPPHPDGYLKNASEPQATWYLRSSHPGAQRSREMINAWYADFPAACDAFMAKLRHINDRVHQSALDELFLYALLAERYRVVYEEERKATDFRLYNMNELLGSVEVLSLFLDRDWESEMARSGQLEDALNNALSLREWFVGYEILQWNPERQPSLSVIVDWVRRCLDGLPAQSDRPPADLHQREYRDRRRGVRILFQFIQRVSGRPPKPGDRIVGSPASIGGFVNARQRLRATLDKKVTKKKYDLRGRPFAIVVANHDFSCDDEEIFEAVYGDGGFFMPYSDGSVRNTRVSSILILQHWQPWSHDQAHILELPNPYAQQAFQHRPFAQASRLTSPPGVCHRQSLASVRARGGCGYSSSMPDTPPEPADVVAFLNALAEARTLVDLDQAALEDLSACRQAALDALGRGDVDALDCQLRRVRYLLVELADGPIAAFLADSAARLLASDIGRLFIRRT